MQCTLRIFCKNIKSITFLIHYFAGRLYGTVSQISKINKIADLFYQEKSKREDPACSKRLVKGVCQFIVLMNVLILNWTRNRIDCFRLFLWYYLHIWLMLGIDVIFTYRQRSIYLFKNWIPESFICEEHPCNHGQVSAKFNLKILR